MSGRFLRLLWWIGAGAGCLVWGQDASVTGIVTDQAGALMPGVQIKIRNTDTNITRGIETNPEGIYTITGLPPGPYELKAEMNGFRTFVQTGIVLEVGQALRSDIQMVVGSVSEAVSVTAEIAPLNTESGAVTGDVITHQEIRELPVEGRDFTDLAFLVPGVMPKAQGGQGSAMAINGARADSTNFYVDGFNNRNARGAAAQVRPNMGAMQEFKMEVSGFSAEYGRMAGGVINMVLRSGTNRYGGEVFEYVRNNLIDARAFFDAERLKLNRHQFGATLHGPLSIPRWYEGRNRTFFLYSWESYRQLVGVTGLARVPTELERSGDFTRSLTQTGAATAVKDPYNRNAPFPGNLIPASRFHQTAVNLLAYYPLPNRPDAKFNFRTSASDKDSWNSFIWKVDHRFNESNSLSYRYQVRPADTTGPFDGGNLGTFGKLVDETRALMGLNFTHLFSPAFLVEVQSGFSRNRNVETCVWSGQDMAAKLGLAGSTREPELLGFPKVTVLDYEQLGCDENKPVLFFVTDIQQGGKFTWVKSRHVLKWGAHHSRVRFNQPYYNNNRGTYAFQDRWTGHSVGDLLLGLLNNTSRVVGWNRNYLRSTSIGLFFNDDFKFKPNLTLNLGLRYELNTPPYDRYDRMASFVPGLAKIVIANPDVPGLAETVERAGMAKYMATAKEAGLPRSLVHTDYTNLAPRFGFAWRPRNARNTVVRGGYGIFYTGHVLNPVRNDLQNSFPFIAVQNFSRLSSNPDMLTLTNPFPPERLTLGGTNSSRGFDERAPTGYLQSYNFTVEREVFDGMVWELGFVGSKGTHLGRKYDINFPRRTMAAYLANIATRDLRPFPFLDGAINYYAFGVNSIYNAGVFSLRKRTRGGLFYRLNYIYSKSIDDASQIGDNSDGGYSGAQDPDNYKAERGRSDWDRGHVVTVAFSWPVPFGRGRRWLGATRGPAELLLGGWQLAGTGSFSSGPPFTVTAADVDRNLGESDRPNRLSKGVPREIPGLRRGVDYPWFDVAAFEKVPRCSSRTEEGCGPSPNGFLPFRFGNAGRNILDGPGLAYLNLSAMKNFRMGERRNLQFRMESYNALNHPNFNLPVRTFNTTAAGMLNGVANTGRGGPRVFQAALRFSF